MGYEEIKFGQEMHEFRVNEAVEGELKEIREDVGKNKATVYVVGDKTFWGTNVLDSLMSRLHLGQKIRITMVDDAYKFPNGRVGRQFKVEVNR